MLKVLLATVVAMLLVACKPSYKEDRIVVYVASKNVYKYRCKKAFKSGKRKYKTCYDYYFIDERNQRNSVDSFVYFKLKTKQNNTLVRTKYGNYRVE